VPGGILIANPAQYDAWSQRLLLGSLFGPIAADIARAAAPGARILEVGSGPGHLAGRLAGDHGFDVTGVDLDPAMVERARANAARSADRVKPEFVVGDAAALPFPDASFDLAVSTLSMHHWAKPATGLVEIRRVLCPGGRALVWDFRSGRLPLHRPMPDPVAPAHRGGLEVVSVTSWRWPWRFRLLTRIELMRSAEGGTRGPGLDISARAPLPRRTLTD
jgi:ubiquinone/menaquinone biosynthesis C-methylase UbiE